MEGHPLQTRGPGIRGGGGEKKRGGDFFFTVHLPPCCINPPEGGGGKKKRGIRGERGTLLLAVRPADAFTYRTSKWGKRKKGKKIPTTVFYGSNGHKGEEGKKKKKKGEGKRVAPLVRSCRLISSTGLDEGLQCIGGRGGKKNKKGKRRGGPCWMKGEPLFPLAANGEGGGEGRK